jgi:hypothetical protein
LGDDSSCMPISWSSTSHQALPSSESPWSCAASPSTNVSRSSSQRQSRWC